MINLAGDDSTNFTKSWMLLFILKFVVMAPCYGHMALIRLKFRGMATVSDIVLTNLIIGMSDIKYPTRNARQKKKMEPRVTKYFTSL
jgi:hypothetical protein